MWAYVADLGGNIYRISGADANTPFQAGDWDGTNLGWTITKIASLGCATAGGCTPTRKFMMPLDVVEQNVDLVRTLAHRVAFMDRGRIAEEKVLRRAIADRRRADAIGRLRHLGGQQRVPQCPAAIVLIRKERVEEPDVQVLVLTRERQVRGRNRSETAAGGPLDERLGQPFTMTLRRQPLPPPLDDPRQHVGDDARPHAPSPRSRRSSTETGRTAGSAGSGVPTWTRSTAQSVSLCSSSQPSRNAGQSVAGSKAASSRRRSSWTCGRLMPSPTAG